MFDDLKSYKFLRRLILPDHNVPPFDILITTMRFDVYWIFEGYSES